MAANNTVEVTLRSRFEDGVSKGIQHTKSVLESGFRAMKSSAAALQNGFVGAFDAMRSGVAGWLSHTLNAFRSAQGGLAKLRTAGLAVAAALGLAFYKAAQAVGRFAAQIIRDSSTLLDLRASFDEIAASAGVAADKLRNELLRATGLLVDEMVLLKEANRVLAAEIRPTAEEYVRLTRNIYFMAKAAGVDYTQALRGLSDALLSGEVETLKAVGVTVKLEDVVGRLAKQLGVTTGEIDRQAKMHALYRALLEQTDRAVAKIPQTLTSADDALTATRNAWSVFINSVGMAAQKSAVFQELMGRVVARLLEFVSRKEDVAGFAMATNRFLIGAITGFAQLMRVLGYAATAWDALAGGVKLFVDVLGVAFFGQLAAVELALEKFFRVLSLLPGAVGEAHRRVADAVRQTYEYHAEATRQFAAGVQDAFSGFGERQAELEQLAASAYGLAAEMSKLANQVASGGGAAAAMSRFADDSAAAGQQVSELNRQVERFQILLRELGARTATPYEAALGRYIEDLRRIDELTAIDEERKNQLRLLAARSYFEELKRLREEDAQNAQEHIQRLAEQMREAVQLQRIGSAQAPAGIALPPVPGPPPEIKQWQRPLLELHQRLMELNQIGMDPFRQTMAAMKQNALDFAVGAGQAFASFFADIVSGQENAGKKLIAAFLGMIGQMLMRTGVMLIQVGIAEMALANTLVGRALGASHAAGVRAVATGAVLAAVGGAMTGAAAAMAQTSQAGPGGSFQQSVPRPTASQQVQIINVGAPGRAQTPGQVSAAPVEVRLKVESNDSHIVKVVEKNVAANGRLRLVLENA